MRIILALFVVFVMTIADVAAQPFRIATWQVPDIQLPKLTNAGPQNPTAQVQAIADTLSSADADAVILYGLTDGAALKAIGDAMKPKRYSVAIHSAFRHGGPKGIVVGQPFGILTRKERMATKNFNWSDTGRIDMPGGFTFATFKHGQGAVCVYVANMPGSLTNGVSSSDGAYIARKRNYAAEFLGHHASWITTTYTNQPFALYITGDINLAPRKPVRDECAAILEKAGFRPVPVGTIQDKSTFSITNGMAYNRVFDPVFTRTVEFVSTRQIARPAPEESLIICEITLRSAGSASLPASRKPAPAPVAPSPAPEPVLPPPAPVVAATEPANTVVAPAPTPDSRPVGAAAPASFSPGQIIGRSWFRPSVVVVAFALLLFVMLGVRKSKQRKFSTALSRRANDAVFVEMNSTLPRKPVLHPGTQAMLAEPTTATDNSHNVLWQAPDVRIESERLAEAGEARAGLMPHLRRLMREKLFIWLSAQRSHLINSHETGTEKVLGLEERLEKIQDQFQDRLIAQQQRIAELDRELQAKEKIIKESQREKQQGGDSQSNN